MEDTAINIKAFIATLLAFFTALWGWFGWLVVAWVALMAADYLTGSLIAKRQNEWTSARAREGIQGKGMMLLVVAVAGILDLVLGLIIDNMSFIHSPFEYTVFICPLMVVWYIVTELGSILENVTKASGHVPPFLIKLVIGMKAAVGKAGDKLAEQANPGPEEKPPDEISDKAQE